MSHRTSRHQPALPAVLAALPLLCAGAAGRAAEAGPGPANGAALFATHCQTCHQAGGEGAAGIAPPLAGTLAKRAELPEGQRLLAQTVVTGLSGPISSRGERYNGNMPSFAALANEELAAVLSHVLASFNASAVRILPEQIASARQTGTKPAELRQHRERLLAQTGE